MSQIARQGDIGVGTCKCHKNPISMSGIVMATTSIVFCDGIPVARQGDIVLGNCGHTGIIVSSSGVTTAQGKAIARVGDTFVGCFTGVIVSGSPKTDTI
jgi:uncharacterized Zn-binding protein involved in type VI secretion